MTALKIVFLLAAPLKVKTRGGDKILLSTIFENVPK